jgi:predicted transcriptional regulator
MAERILPHNVMTAEEVLKTEIILNQALIDLLIRKEIITVEELVHGIKEIKNEQEASKNDWDILIR